MSPLPGLQYVRLLIRIPGVYTPGYTIPPHTGLR
jgi:hypothetical protein